MHTHAGRFESETVGAVRHDDRAVSLDIGGHEYASQMNMYLNYYRYEVTQPDDNPPVGLLLCTGKGDTLVKYATAGLDQNIFVQKYMINLPSVEDLTSYIEKETEKERREYRNKYQLEYYHKKKGKLKKEFLDRYSSI